MFCDAVENKPHDNFDWWHNKQIGLYEADSVRVLLSLSMGIILVFFQMFGMLL